MSSDNSGQAFPSEGEGHNDPRYHSPGMTLRDYFAAKAMNAWTIDDNDVRRLQNGEQPSWAGMASYCYAFADAMLAEREK